MKFLIPLFVLFLSSIQAEESAALKQEVAVFARYGDRELKLDWHRLDDKIQRPGIVLVHGGGWIGGNPASFNTTAQDLARAGYVVANVEYRLATEEKFPGAVLDVKAAVRWMRANAVIMGLDPDRIGAVGGSAGGHLVAMLAATADEDAFPKAGNDADQSDVLQAAVIMGAGVDQVARVKEAKNGSIKNCVIFFGGEYSEIPEVYAAGSPITHLSEKTAPILMLDGEFDNPGQRYPAYREKLDGFGVFNEFVMIPGAKHGEWGKGAFRPAFVAAMVSFLDSTLK